MASGFDVAGTISQIMEIEGKRVEAIQDEQTELYERIDAWMDINTSMRGLRDSLDTLRWMDVWDETNAESSNELVLQATANDAAASAEYAVEVTQLAYAHTIAGGTAASLGIDDSSTVLVGNVAGLNVGDEFVIGGEAISISADDTLSSLRTKINNAAENMADDDKVFASILDNRLVIQRVNTGASEITLSDLVGTPLQALGVLDGGGNPANELLAAQNALFNVNGADVERSSNLDLSDVIEGVSLTLNGVGSSSLVVDKDKEAIKEAISAFVAAYNTVTEQLEDYSEVDITTDPDNPRTAILQGETLVSQMHSSLRRKATELKYSTHTEENSSYSYAGETGVMNSLSHLGIWTSSKDNRLEIVDEDRLDYMLDNYMDEVEQLFRGVSVPGEGRQGGVAADLHEVVYAYSEELSGTVDDRIARLQSEVNSRDERIDRLLIELAQTEDQLWKDFGAMEAAIARMNSDLDRLLGALGQNG